MGVIHQFADGSFGIGHITGTNAQNCACNPDRTVNYKARTSGRGGRHQGYTTQVTWNHNTLPVTV